MATKIKTDINKARKIAMDSISKTTDTEELLGSAMFMLNCYKEYDMVAAIDRQCENSVKQSNENHYG